MGTTNEGGRAAGSPPLLRCYAHATQPNNEAALAAARPCVLCPVPHVRTMPLPLRVFNAALATGAAAGSSPPRQVNPYADSGGEDLFASGDRSNPLGAPTQVCRGLGAGGRCGASGVGGRWHGRNRQPAQ